MVEDTDVKELVERAQQGDRAAFDRLVESLADSLTARIARRIGPQLGEKLDPEDVLQETFLRAFQSIRDFRWQGEKSFQRWLEGISVNFILHSARQHGLRKHWRIVRDPVAGDTSPSHHQRRDERFERLQRSIDQLSPEYRSVVHLSRIKGLKLDEIAERLGRSTSSVRNLLFRAMKQLRESFGDTESLSLPDRRFDEDGAPDGK